MSPDYDIAIVGSGFAGSLMAMIAKRIGFKVVMLEKGKHPRVVIGESSTPLSNLLLESLADRYDLPQIKPLCKWGAWQHSYPQVACGLKRGFTFFHHDRERETDFSALNRHLLVAASPHDAIADTHWYRADFDQLLAEQAQELGVDYFDEAHIDVASHDEAGWVLSVTRGASARQIRAKFVVDATGPRGFLHRALHLEEVAFPVTLVTSALYSHFSGVRDFSPIAGDGLADAPYPPDAAAVHHVFDGGWIWVLQFNNGITSAGIVAQHHLARSLRFEQKDAAWQQVLESLPSVKEQFADATPEIPFTHIANLPFLSSQMVGNDWALLPSAGGFVDPMLSTGFPLTLLGVTRLGKLLERDWGMTRMQASLADYAEHTTSELVATADLISALYENLKDFELFRHLSLLYFAAASYAETARRLNRAELSNSFLLHAHPVFGDQCRRLLNLARQPLTGEQRAALINDIHELIAEFDVAGLGKRPANHFYPVNAEDLYDAANKFGASKADIDQLLVRAGFFQAVSETR